MENTNFHQLSQDGSRKYSISTKWKQNDWLLPEPRTHIFKYCKTLKLAILLPGKFHLCEIRKSGASVWGSSDPTMQQSEKQNTIQPKADVSRLIMTIGHSKSWPGLHDIGKGCDMGVQHCKNNIALSFTNRIYQFHQLGKVFLNIKMSQLFGCGLSYLEFQIKYFISTINNTSVQ